jgi:DNA-binding transcriptional ArsR family regulator
VLSGGTKLPNMSLEVSALRAVAHPVRLQMLSLLTGSAMSAAELSRELGLTQANASYHLRTLVAAGLVSSAGEERVRGGKAKRYRYDLDAPVEAPTGADLGPMFAEALATELVRRARMRRPDGQGTTTDAELWVDPEVWDDARVRVSEAMRALHLEAQPPRREGTVRVSVTVAMFAMDEAAST